MQLISSRLNKWKKKNVTYISFIIVSSFSPVISKISFVVSFDLLATTTVDSTRIFNFTDATAAIVTELARHTTFAGRSRFRSTAGRRRTRRTVAAIRARGNRQDPTARGATTTTSCTATRKRRFFRLDKVRCAASLKGNAHSGSKSVRVDGSVRIVNYRSVRQIN